VVRIVLVAALAGLGFAACTLFSEGPPENVCDGDDDCFRAQGETCNLDTRTCVPGPAPMIDAGVDAP
jgi:hypothetical protein